MSSALGTNEAQLIPRHAPDKALFAELDPATQVERVIVKFREGTRVRLRGGALAVDAAKRTPRERAALEAAQLDDASLSADLSRVKQLLPQLDPLFAASEEELEVAKLAGEQQGRELADLSLYVTTELAPATELQHVADTLQALNALASVEIAYAEPPPRPAQAGPPVTPDFEWDQLYLTPAPVGIDAQFAWAQRGGSGAGISIVAVERDSGGLHEDLPAPFFEDGTGSGTPRDRDHATEVSGVLVAGRNGVGVTGIAYLAQLGLVSTASQPIANAVRTAARAAGPGNVVLLALDIEGPAVPGCTDCGRVPVEYAPATFDAIALATASGMVVVEAAGNGGVDLDDARYGGLFDRAIRDSGAIVVAASEVATRGPHRRTNHGSRIDAFAWGDSVTTTGVGDRFDGGKGRTYTSGFDDTSSAASIVAGAAADVQGVTLARGNPALTSLAMRTLLRRTGTEQATGNVYIGYMPNLRSAIGSTGLLPVDKLVSITQGRMAGVELALDPITSAPGREGPIFLSGTYHADSGDQALTFKVVPGLADPACYSFQSRMRPDVYLRHFYFRMRGDVRAHTPQFAADATFCAEPALSGGSGVSLRSFNFPARYVRSNSAREIWLDLPEDSPSFRDSASWQLRAPWWESAVDIALPAFRNQGSLRAANINLPDHFVRHFWFEGFAHVVTPASDLTTRLDATFHVERGLAEHSCYSFASRNVLGYYLRDVAGRVRLEPFDTRDDYRRDATFCTERGPFGEGLRLRSYSHPRKYLRHHDFALWMATGDGDGPAHETPFRFIVDSTWYLNIPMAP